MTEILALQQLDTQEEASALPCFSIGASTLSDVATF